MKRLIYFAALVLMLCCGWSVGFKSSPSAHDITFATNTTRPTPTASPVPVYAPQNEALAVEETTAMNTELYVLIIVVLSAIVGALIFVLRSYGLSLRDSLPPSFVPILPIMFNALTDLSKRTASPADDKLVELLKQLLGEPAEIAVEPPAENG